MNAREPLDESQLLVVLEEQWTQAEDYYGSDIAEGQANCIDFYNAEPFGDEVEGKSQVVLPDVQDAVDHMTIQVTKPFISGDRVIEFEARDEDGVEFADEATEAVSQTFMRGQNGFRVIHDWCKAGLKERYCAMKSMLEIERRKVTKRYTIDADQLAVLDEETASTATQGDDGQFEVTVQEVIETPRFYDYTIPSEEFRFSRRARSEDDADYLAHACRKTRSDLVAMGFDVEQVYDLPTGSESLTFDRRSAARDQYFMRDDNINPSMQEVLLLEEYIRIDADGDGIAELLRVFRVDKTILEVTEVNDHPFTVWTPFPEPHRLVGNGLADKAMMTQRIRSIVARQLLNGMYSHNEPRFWIPSESTTDDTLDDLLETVGPIRGRGAPPTLLQGNFDVSKSLTVLEFFSREREVRTGITDTNQGLAPDVLNTTATGAQLQHENGQQTSEFITRVFAEALARVFVKKMKLLKEVGQPLSIKMDGEYKVVDPSQWPEEVDVLIRVGLGTNNKQARIAMRMQLLEVQREALTVGLADNKGIFKNLASIVKDAGLGQADDLFVNPESDDGQPTEQQPDPAMLEMQAKAQLDQAKLQGEQQLAQQRIQLMQAEATEKANLARQQAALDAELARDKADAEMQLAERRMAFEQDLANRRMQFEAATRMAREMPQDRPGGSLAA